MIKVYKLKSREDINKYEIGVPQKYRFTPNKEYIGRELKRDIMTIYDDIGCGIEFPIRRPGKLQLGLSFNNYFDIVSISAKNEDELREEIIKTINKM